MADNSTSPVFLDRASILTLRPRKIEDVDVPEWGGKVRVRALSGAERDHFEASLQSSKTGDSKLNLRNFRAKLVILAACDDRGNQILSETDVQQLGQTSAAALQRVFEVAQRLAGMTKEDVEELTGEAETQSGSFDSD